MPVRFAGVRERRNENRSPRRRIAPDVSGSSTLPRFGVPVGDYSNLDVVLCTQPSGEPLAPALDELEACSAEDRDKVARSGDVSFRVLPEPALSHGLALPSPSTPLAHVPEGNHALGLLEVVVEPLHHVIELCSVASDEEVPRFIDVGEGPVRDASDGLRGMLEPHVAELLALRRRRWHSTPDVSGEAEAAGHVTAKSSSARSGVVLDVIPTAGE